MSITAVNKLRAAAEAATEAARSSGQLDAKRWGLDGRVYAARSQPAGRRGLGFYARVEVVEIACRYADCPYCGASVPIDLVPGACWSTHYPDGRILDDAIRVPAWVTRPHGFVFGGVEQCPPSVADPLDVLHASKVIRVAVGSRVRLNDGGQRSASRLALLAAWRDLAPSPDLRHHLGLKGRAW